MHANSFAATAPVAWRIIAALVAVKLAVHAWADGVAAWGYMTDELCLSTPLDAPRQPRPAGVGLLPGPCRDVVRRLQALWPELVTDR